MLRKSLTLSNVYIGTQAGAVLYKPRSMEYMDRPVTLHGRRRISTITINISSAEGDGIIRTYLVQLLIYIIQIFFSSATRRTLHSLSISLFPER